MNQSLVPHESLLKWINPKDNEQAEWIQTYLKRKVGPALLTELTHLAHAPEGFKVPFRGNLVDANFRELIKQMRGAWNQRQYRKKTGKQVSFQLPTALAKELAKIARARSRSRTQTLCQVIREAAEQSQIDNKKIRKLKEHLKNLEKSKIAAIAAREQVFRTLLEMLAEEVTLRLCYEIALGPMSTDELAGRKASPEYQEALAKRSEEIDGRLTDLRLMKAKVRSLTEYLQSQ